MFSLRSTKIRHVIIAVIAVLLLSACSTDSSTEEVFDSQTDPTPPETVAIPSVSEQPEPTTNIAEKYLTIDIVGPL